MKTKEQQIQENELFNAKRKEFKDLYGERGSYYFYDFLYDYSGVSNHPTALKLDMLQNQMDKKHIIAILDKKGNVLKVGSTRTPKGYLWNYLQKWDTPKEVIDMFNNKELPRVEIIQENMNTGEALVLRKELDTNKAGLKRKIKINTIIND